jgi:hypothetical protein
MANLSQGARRISTAIQKTGKAVGESRTEYNPDFSGVLSPQSRPAGALTDLMNDRKQKLFHVEQGDAYDVQQHNVRNTF